MKFVVYILIALGAALYFPQSRAVVMGYAAPVINPVLRWSTTNEMERIVGDLENEAQTRSWIPEPGEEFQDWMARNYQGEDSRLDSWDRPYVLDIGRREFRLLSLGPDGERATADDIVITGESGELRR